MMISHSLIALLIASMVSPMTVPFAQAAPIAISKESPSDFLTYLSQLKTDVSAGRMTESQAQDRLNHYFMTLAVDGKDVLAEVISSLKNHSDLPGSSVLAGRLEKAQTDLNRLKARMESEAQRSMSERERQSFRKRWERAFASVVQPLQKDLVNLSQTGSRLDDYQWICVGSIGGPAVIGLVIGIIVYVSKQADLGDTIEYATRRPVIQQEKNTANVQAEYDAAVAEVRANQENAIAEKTKLDAEIANAVELKAQGQQTILVGGVQVQIDTYLETKRNQLNTVEVAIHSGDAQAIAAYDKYQLRLKDVEAQYQTDLAQVSADIEQAKNDAGFWNTIGFGVAGGLGAGLFIGGIMLGCFGGY